MRVLKYRLRNIEKCLIVLAMCTLLTIGLSPIKLGYSQAKTSLSKWVQREGKLYGGTVRVPEFADVGTLNQFMATTTWEFEIIDLVYDPLVIMAPDMSFVGRLAKDWEVSEDGLTWTFYLYENATWHDGVPVTAEDCKFTYDLWLEYKMGRLADLVDMVNSTEALDDYTFVLHLNYPYAPLLTRLVQAQYIVPKHIWENVDDPTTFSNMEHPIGSGPFKFVERAPGQYIKLAANPDYHLGRPFVDYIIWPIISNPDAMLMAFMAGEIDAVTWTIPYSTVENMKTVENPHIKLVEIAETGARYLIFQCTRYPTNQTWFRHVVAHCINVTEVVETVYQGYADPGNNGRISPALTKYYNPDTEKEKMYPYNLTRAAELLDEHGFIDIDGDGWREDDHGNKLELTLYSPAYDPCRVRWGEMLTEGLAAVGIKVNYQPLEWTALVDYLNSANFDMLIIGGVGSTDPDLLYGLYHTEGGWNKGRTNYSNPELDQLLEQQRKMINETERIVLIKQIQVEIAKEIPLLNVVHQHFIFAYRDDRIAGWVTGPLHSPDNFFSFMNIYDVSLAQQQQQPEQPEKVEVIPPWAYALAVITVIAVVCAVYLGYAYRKKVLSTK